MKVLTTCLVALTLCSVAIGQPGELQKIEKHLSAGKANLTLTSLFELINVDKDKFFNQKSIESGNVYFIRDYGDYQKLSFSTAWFDFLLLVDNDDEKIMFSSVDISGRKSADGKAAFNQYHNSFKAHIKAHETLYGVKIDLKDEIMSPINNYTFGTGCGWNGPLPEKGMKMFELVKNGDQEALVNWVKSMNPTIQAYGVMGLHFMKMKGHKIKLKKKDKKIIDMVKTQKTVIDYCSNIDLNATTPMNSVLNDFFLDSIWEVFKDSKYLR